MSLSMTIPRAEPFHADTQLRAVDPDWTAPYYPQTPASDGPMERFLSPVHSTFGNSPSVTFDICDRPRYLDKPLAFYRYRINYEGSEGEAPFTIDHISTGYFPIGFFDTHRMGLGKRRISTNGVDVPCVVGKLRITAPEMQWQTFIYGPNESTKEVDMGEAGEAQWPRDGKGGEGASVTPLEPYLFIASCSASGRFIYRRRNALAAFLAEYM